MIRLRLNNNDTISSKRKKHQNRSQQLRELNAKRRKKSTDRSLENTLMMFQQDTRRYEPQMTFQSDAPQTYTAQSNEWNSTSETMKKPLMTSAERSRAYRKRKKKKISVQSNISSADESTTSKYFAFVSPIIAEIVLSFRTSCIIAQCSIVCIQQLHFCCVLITGTGMTTPGNPAI